MALSGDRSTIFEFFFHSLRDIFCCFSFACSRARSACFHLVDTILGPLVLWTTPPPPYCQPRLVTLATPEKLVRLCPHHAKRFARAAVPMLRNLPPLAGEEAGGSRGKPGGGGDGSSSRSGGADCANDNLSMAQASLGAAAAAVVAAERSAAATETLLGLRRPLEAFLRTRVASSAAPGSSISLSPSATATPGRRRRRSFGEKAGGALGGDGVGGREDDQRHGEGGEARPRGRLAEPAAEATGATAAAYPELEVVLLPRCIVPLFEAAAGGKRTEAAERREGAREKESRSAERQEMKRGLLSCLKAVMEVSPRSGSGNTTADPGLDALRK